MLLLTSSSLFVWCPASKTRKNVVKDLHGLTRLHRQRLCQEFSMPSSPFTKTTSKRCEKSQ
eukprot:3230848-Amphidinium_carterae.1